jgi:CRP/FNR family nitrogen fixation transcriptional regulator
MMRRAALPRAETPLRAIGTVRNFVPHQTIFAEGEPAPYFMLVIHGMVRSCSNFSDGRRFIGAFYAGGDMFGLERNPAHLASAEAVSDTALVLYPAPDWFTVFHAQDDLSLRIFSAIMRSFEQAQCHARLLARLRAVERLALFLLECHERAHLGMLVTLEMTRQDIADYLGLTVETVSRSLAQLKRDKLIGLRSSRQIDLLDIPGLREITG